MSTITDEAELRRVYRAPMERALRKQLDHLDTHCLNFLSLSPFCVLSTHDVEGRGDVSPRGGAPGFVHAIDNKTLALPDRPGNNRLDSISNLLARPGVGLLFLVPGVDETLRINGRGELRTDDDLLARFAVDERKPAAVILIRVDEAYLHCAKALMRSALWDADSRIDRKRLPTMGQMLKDQIGMAEQAESQDAMLARYRTQLY